VTAPDGTGLARRERILLTGASGRVARLVRPLLQQPGREIVVTDRSMPPAIGEGERFMSARLDRLRDMMRVADGATAIVHLGGIADESSWGKLYRANVLGTTNVLDAARARGVASVVLASSMHVFGLYGREEPIHEDTPPRPDSRYAVSKVLNEAAARLYAEKYGMTVACLRIGSANADPLKAEPGLGIGAVDLARLIDLCVSRRDPGYLVLHAIAPHGGAAFTDGRLRDRFGFAFTAPGPDRAELDKAVDRWFARDPLGCERRGGYFVGRDADMV
jgi:uronate dehydrogenase